MVHREREIKRLPIKRLGRQLLPFDAGVALLRRQAREATLCSLRSTIGVDAGRVAAAYPATFHGQEGVLFIGKAQEKDTVFRAEMRHDPETGRRWSAWNCLTWRCANSGSIASAHRGGRAINGGNGRPGRRRAGCRVRRSGYRSGATPRAMA